MSCTCVAGQEVSMDTYLQTERRQTSRVPYSLPPSIRCRRPDGGTMINRLVPSCGKGREPVGRSMEDDGQTDGRTRSIPATCCIFDLGSWPVWAGWQQSVRSKDKAGSRRPSAPKPSDPRRMSHEV